MFESDDISTLKSLAATTRDSIEGYRDAASAIGSGSRFAGAFDRLAQDREGAATTLDGAIAAMGGKPETDGTILGAAHRTFMDLKARITGRDDKAIVDEVERGEDHIKGAFEKALADTRLKPATLAAIRTAWASVEKGHGEMSRLKHELAAEYA